MPRRPRFVMPGLPYHITQRGNNRQNVFFSDLHRLRYLEILREHALRHQLELLGWCLMTNHVHLIAVPVHARSLALALQESHSRYSLELNREHRWCGHLWQNRFFSCPLENSHFLNALQYVEQNPVRAHLVTSAWDWPWSSARAHTTVAAPDGLLDPGWIDLIQQRLLAKWNCADWRDRLAASQPEDDLHDIRRATNLGQPLGSNAFLQKLEKAAGRRLRVWNQGRPKLDKPFTLAGQQSLFSD